MNELFYAMKDFSIVDYNNVCVEHEGGAWTNDDVMLYMRVGGVWACVRWDFHSEWFVSPSPFFFFYTSRKEPLFDDRSIRENENIRTRMLSLSRPPLFHVGLCVSTGRSRLDQLTRSLCLTNHRRQWVLGFVKQWEIVNWLSCCNQAGLLPINHSGNWQDQDAHTLLQCRHQCSAM